MLVRRAFLAQALAMLLLLARRAAAEPPKIGRIRWPGPEGDLHGFMAIPGAAHGKQPAVLVVHDARTVDAYGAAMADSLAQAGYVACVPTTLSSLEDGRATVRWLATNAYSTGRVAAVGLGWGGAMVERLAAAPDSALACAITFGESTHSPEAAAVPLLRLDAPQSAQDPAYAAAWAEALAFLAAHLHQERRQRSAMRKMRGPSHR
jgi:carboxymethylenebutenolidase